MKTIIPCLLLAASLVAANANADVTQSAKTPWPTYDAANSQAERDQMRQQFMNASPEQRRHLQDQMRKRFQNMSPDQKAQMREAMQQKFQQMSPEEKDRMRQRFQSAMQQSQETK